MFSSYQHSRYARKDQLFKQLTFVISAQKQKLASINSQSADSQHLENKSLKQEELEFNSQQVNQNKPINDLSIGDLTSTLGLQDINTFNINDLQNQLDIQQEERQQIRKAITTNEQNLAYIKLLLKAINIKNKYLKSQQMLTQTINSHLNIIDQKIRFNYVCNVREKIIRQYKSIQVHYKEIILLTIQASKISCLQKISLPNYTIEQQNLYYKLYHKPIYTLLQLQNLFYYSGFYDNEKDAIEMVKKLNYEMRLKKLTINDINLMLLFGNNEQIHEDIITRFNQYIDLNINAILGIQCKVFNGDNMQLFNKVMFEASTNHFNEEFHGKAFYKVPFLSVQQKNADTVDEKPLNLPAETPQSLLQQDILKQANERKKNDAIRWLQQGVRQKLNCKASK